VQDIWIGLFFWWPFTVLLRRLLFYDNTIPGCDSLFNRSYSLFNTFCKDAKGITVHFLIYLLLFFLLYFERTRKKRAEAQGCNISINKWYCISMSVFLAVIFVISLVVPKPSVIPRLAYVNAVIEQVVQPLGGGAAQQNLFQSINSNLYNPLSLKKQSQLDSMTAPLSDRILFEVAAEEPLYLRIQSWDKYENNVWKLEIKSCRNTSLFPVSIMTGLSTMCCKFGKKSKGRRNCIAAAGRCFGNLEL